MGQSWQRGILKPLEFNQQEYNDHSDLDGKDRMKIKIVQLRYY